tara:strand:- start:514 stop:945 length:432 start_codon:yes stop_codon:yes gene_type:complete
MESKNNSINKIISKIGGISTDLKSQKIELSIVGDMNKQEKKINALTKRGNEIANEYDEERRELDQQQIRMEETQEIMGQLETEGKQVISFLGQSSSEAQVVLNKAVSMANELGVAPSKINGYKNLLNSVETANETDDNLRSSF